MKHLHLMVALTLAPMTFASAQTGAPTLQFQSAKVQAQYEWEQDPSMGAPAQLLIQFTDSQHQPVTLPGTLKVMLWMPSMGHGSSPTVVEAVKDEFGQVRPGLYRVSKIQFIMRGEWEVRVMIQASDATFETQAFPIRIR